MLTTLGRKQNLKDQLVSDTGPVEPVLGVSAFLLLQSVLCCNPHSGVLSGAPQHSSGDGVLTVVFSTETGWVL
jgi:hypothetical protein